MTRQDVLQGPLSRTGHYAQCGVMPGALTAVSSQDRHPFKCMSGRRIC